MLKSKAFYRNYANTSLFLPGILAVNACFTGRHRQVREVTNSYTEIESHNKIDERLIHSSSKTRVIKHVTMYCIMLL